MTRKLNVVYFFRIFITTSILPFPSSLRLWPHSIPALTHVTTNSEFNYILDLHITHFQTWPPVSKWKLQVSVERCLTSQHTKLHPNSKYIFSFPTKCTCGIEYFFITEYLIHVSALIAASSYHLSRVSVLLYICYSVVLQCMKCNICGSFNKDFYTY
jgi:hypothetical protein